MESSNIVYKQHNSILSQRELVTLISEIEASSEVKFMSLPPVKPKGGDIILFKNELKPNDWKADQYNWRDKSKGDSSSNISFKLYYIHIDPNEAGSCLSTFQKRVYQTPKRNFVILHYLGDSSVFPKEGIHHGNRVHFPDQRPFTRTVPSLFKEMKEPLSLGSKPLKTYNKLQACKRMEQEGDARERVDRPRDKKQVKNVAASHSRESKISYDAIYSLFYMASSLDSGKFIWTITIHPSLMIMAGSVAAMQLAKYLIQVSGKQQDLAQLVSYDTTFKLGHYYVSTVVMRNIALEGDPIFPAGLVVHERKFTEIHLTFLKTILNLIELNKNKNIPFVTDGEKPILLAMRKTFPEIPHILCRNHIKEDIKRWLLKHSAQLDDNKVYLDHLEHLLDAETIEHFDNLFLEFSQKWSNVFLNYFKTHQLRNIRDQACRAVTSRFPAFDNKLATNNLSESLNSILKQSVEWKELEIDRFLLAFYFLQGGYLNEFRRATKRMGSHVLKKIINVKDLEKILDILTEQDTFVPEEEIISRVKGTLPVRDVKSVKLPFNPTAEVLGQICFEQKLYKSIPEFHLFVIQNIGGKNISYSTVQLGNEEQLPKCSCRVGGRCYHIRCVEYILKQSYKEPSRSLSLLKKRIRIKDGEGPSGRKKPRKNDLDYKIFSAPDSIESLALSMDEKLFTTDDSSDEDNILVDENLTLSSPLVKDLPPWKKDFPVITTSTMIDSPALKFLLPGEELTNFLLDDVIPNLILQSGNKTTVAYLSTSDFDFVETALATQQNIWNSSFIKAVIKKMNINEVANKSIIFSAILRNHHFILAYFHLRNRQIIILDSLRKINLKDYDEIFKVLINMGSLIYLSAGVENQKSWECIISNDCPQQQNSYDCGIYAILNAASALLSFSYNNSVYDSNNCRNWVASQYETPQFRMSYRDVDVIGIDLKDILLSWQPQLVAPKICSGATFSSHHKILQSMNASQSNWTMCEYENCEIDDKEHTKSQVLCVKCRKWSHTAHYFCTTTVPEKFFFCNECQNVITPITSTPKLKKNIKIKV